MIATTSPASRRVGRILIVDDEVKILKLLSRYFSRQGHEVKVTTEPYEALRLVQSERFDVLILDHRMPQLTGLEVFKRVRRGESSPRVILMTAHATVEKAVETMKLGAVDYIQKPFDFDSMKEAVRKALEQQSGPEAPTARVAASTETESPLKLVGRSPAIGELLTKD